MTPTYQSGFYAPGRGVPKYPELWRGCVGAWNPGLGNTGLSLRDWSGRQSNASLNNFTPSSAWQNKGGVLGVGSVVDATAYWDTGSIWSKQVDGTKTWAISLWFNTTSSTVEQGLFDSGPFNTYGSLWCRIYNNLITFGMSTTWNVGFTFTQNNQWIHFCLMQTSNGDVYPFINGQDALSARVKIGASLLNTLNNPLRIGAYYNSIYPLKGSITDVRVYTGIDASWTPVYNTVSFHKYFPPRTVAALAKRPGIAYELAPRKIYFLPTSPTSQFFDVLSPSIFAGSI